MKFQYCLAAALSMLLAFLGQSIALYLPASRVNTTSTDTVGLGPALKRGVSLYCYSSDADAAFFERSAENWEASNAGNNYVSFAQNMVQSPGWAGRESEPFLFAQRTIGLDGFECGTNLDGCRQRPTCDQVLTALGDKDEARWVWFVLESIHRLTLVGAVIDQQTVPSELDIVTVAEDAAHTFLRKYDDSKANKCKILAGFVKALILSTFGAVGAVLSTVGPAAAGAVPAIANSAVASSPYLAARGAALVSWGTAFAGNLENNMAGNALDNAICPVDNEKKGLEQSTRIRIKKDIGAFYRTYRTVIQTTNSDIIKGVADNDNPLLLPSTLLANKIKSGVYLDFTPEQDKKFEREGHLLAADLTQYYKNALISTLLKNQMCYIQCHQKKFWKSDITDFEPEQGKFCRARCWDGASELNVYGISEISYDADTWEVELQAFIKASYDNYETNRFQVNPMLPSADQLFNDELAPTDGVFLPVCDSYLDKPKKKGLSGISCMCGDEMGSETAQFWTAANFDRWAEQKIKTEPDRRMQSGRGPQFLCKNDMSIARTPPVTYFINMCNMGWRWPLLKENTEMLMEGSDLRCEAFKEEVQRFQESSDSDKDINCYMCFKSSQGKAIQFGSESQDTYITNLFWGEPPYNRPEKQNYNFHRACQFWEDNHGSCRK